MGWALHDSINICIVFRYVTQTVGCMCLPHAFASGAAWDTSVLHCGLQGPAIHPFNTTFSSFLVAQHHTSSAFSAVATPLRAPRPKRAMLVQDLQRALDLVLLALEAEDFALPQAAADHLQQAHAMLVFARDGLSTELDEPAAALVDDVLGCMLGTYSAKLLASAHRFLVVHLVCSARCTAQRPPALMCPAGLEISRYSGPRLGTRGSFCDAAAAGGRLCRPPACHGAAGTAACKSPTGDIERQPPAAGGLSVGEFTCSWWLALDVSRVSCCRRCRWVKCSSRVYRHHALMPADHVWHTVRGCWPCVRGRKATMQTECTCPVQAAVEQLASSVRLTHKRIALWLYRDVKQELVESVLWPLKLPSM